MLYSSLSLKVVDYDNEDYLSPSDHWTWTNCYKRSWKNLPISHELYAMFMRVPLPPIDKMVCIGLGPISFRPKIESFMLSRGVFNHLGALLIAEALRKRFGATPRLLAQDPEYHPDCKRMLQGKGFEIVGEHGAGGLAEIDGRTLVYAPNPGFCLKEVMADIAEPAAMFWKPVTTPEQEDAETKAENLGDLNVMRLTCLTHKRSVDPDTPRVRALVQKYDKHIFPNNNLYGKIALYTRRGSYRPHPERTCMPKVSRMSNDYARLDHSTRSGAPYSWQVARAPPQAPIDESTPSTSFAPPPPPSPPSSPPASPPAPQTGDAQPPSTTSCSNPEPEQLAIGDLSCLPRRRGSRYVWKYVRAPFITSNVPTDYALGEAEAHLLRISEYGPSRRRPQPQQQQEPEPQQQQEPQPQPQPEPQPQQQQEPRENRVESADGDEESFYRGLGYSF
ncbi:hypothetical protein F5B19DRAFT_139303 [Rostrohypoxylon terebratum]|nr:hypothetical protein F5B19DRAFT_139303 [Rostrohypoxylon terebratum]